MDLHECVMFISNLEVFDNNNHFQVIIILVWWINITIITIIEN